MRKLVLGVVTAGALITAAAAPAMAQVGVYAGPRGVGVGVGPFGVDVGPGPYYGGPYYAAPYNGYYDYAPGWHGGPHRLHQRHYRR
jgi:hypothetical protein